MRQCIPQYLFANWSSLHSYHIWGEFRSCLLSSFVLWKVDYCSYDISINWTSRWHQPIQRYVNHLPFTTRVALLQNLDPGDQNIDDAWETFKCAVHESAFKIIGRPHAQKKPWISELSLNIIEDRRAARLRGDNPDVKQRKETMHWASIRGDTGTRRLLRLNLQWLDKISTLSSGNYGHANSASATNQRPSRLKTVRDSPISKTACVDGKVTSMICLTIHVMQQTPSSSVMLNKQHLVRTRTLTSSQAVK